MEDIKKLNDELLNDVSGAATLWMEKEPGVIYYAPSDDTLKALGLYDHVHSTGGFSDHYYDTYREDTDTWKNVGSDDMLRYVERTFGADDKRYQALCNYCYNGKTK